MIFCIIVALILIISMLFYEADMNQKYEAEINRMKRESKYKDDIILSLCRYEKLHGNVRLGEKVQEELFELNNGR